MNKNKKYFLIITCEHADKQIPNFVKKDIRIPEKILSSHQGYDFGAYNLAQFLNKKLQPQHFQANKISRLVIDYNRSQLNPKLWSRFSKPLTNEHKQKLLNTHQNYRDELLKIINAKSKTQTVLHLAMHSFVPVLNKEKRNAEIGILYDSKRKNEKTFAEQLQKKLEKDFKTRLNYPYLGKADGLTTFLRKSFTKNYLGFEIEINQSVFANSQAKQRLYSKLTESLERLLTTK